MARGIDYGGPGATCNRDPETGIRYGIIPQNALSGDALADFVEIFVARCPHCGEEFPEDTQFTNRTIRKPGGAISKCWAADCTKCGKLVREEEQYGDDADANVVDDGVYQAHLDDDGDAWFTKSPFYTRAAFCAPTCPGACHLSNPCEDGERAFCPGPDWFEGGEAPYPVYSVATNEIVGGSCPICGSSPRVCEALRNEPGSHSHTAHVERAS